MLVAIGAVLTVAGLGIGILLGRSMSPDGKKYRETERKLDQVLQDKKAYEDEVAAHFTDTARLLNNLTDSYRDVHKQLATGAASLCKDMGPISMGRLDGSRDPSEIPADLADVHPPLDYAPKTSPDEKGMLNEEFGLDRRSPRTKAGKVEQT
jgi:uncharacterized membrane-anchored protein YhcB (DUF1043 family)